MSFKNLSKIIQSRRAIYPAVYIDKLISNEIILEILENANWAPTHKKTEPWRFKVFKDQSLNDLSQYLGKYYKDNIEESKYSEIKYKRTIQKPLKSGCAIAICMYNNPETNIPEWEEVAAVACAVQNMWLSCTALNIGCYWSSPKSMINSGEFLGLKKHEKCLGLFYMGYAKELELKGIRSPIEDKIEWM
jgi:nitroreductase